MTGYDFRFAGAALVARGSGALWWPDQGALIVADLHLGKSARMARRGGPLLPPFETRDTLARLAEEITALSPAQVILLGDSYDDDLARDEVDPADRATLAALTAARPFHWIGGNHDPASPMAALVRDGITLRHAATAPGPDISGHYHPKVTLAGRGRRAFLVGRHHLILPAFGTFTGGLSASHPALRDLVGPGWAILLGRSLHCIPLSGAAGGRPDR